MTCPKCSGVMETVSVGLVAVDRCTSCGGLWLDMNEDEWLKRSGAAETVDTGATHGQHRDDRSPIQCPRCHARMMRMVDPGRAGVTYESCAICYGSFFDAGEFREVAGSTGGPLGAFRRWLTGGAA
jgi:Zn-finger nucleic acid-binding protein